MHIDDYTLQPSAAYRCDARLDAGAGQLFTFPVSFRTNEERAGEVLESGIPLPTNVRLDSLDIVRLHEIERDAAVTATASGRGTRPLGLIHLHTGLILPVTLGGWSVARGWTPAGDRALGVSTAFVHPGGAAITLYLYDMGFATIPAGASSEQVRAQLTETEDAVLHIHDTLLSEPERQVTAFGRGAAGFEWLTSSFLVEDPDALDPVRVWIVLTGWENHFVKVRATELETRFEQDDLKTACRAFMDELSGNVVSCS